VKDQRPSLPHAQRHRRGQSGGPGDRDRDVDPQRPRGPRHGAVDRPSWPTQCGAPADRRLAADLQRRTASRQPRPCAAVDLLAEAKPSGGVWLSSVYLTGELTTWLVASREPTWIALGSSWGAFWGRCGLSPATRKSGSITNKAAWKRPCCELSGRIRQQVFVVAGARFQISEPLPSRSESSCGVAE
jgi:hypothetical protein